MLEKTLATMKDMTASGDYRGAANAARAFLSRSREPPESRIAVLLHWSDSASVRELKAPAMLAQPSAVELALEAVRIARTHLPVHNSQRAAAEYQAALCLHSAARNIEAWDHIQKAYEHWSRGGRIDPMRVSLYVEVALESGHATSALAPAKDLHDYETKRAIPATLILANWLYGRCLAAAGDLPNARVCLQSAFDIAKQDGADPEILAEFQDSIRLLAR